MTAAIERQTLWARGAVIGVGDHVQVADAAENHALTLHRALRCAWPLRQRREIGGLRDGELIGLTSEIAIAGARDSHRLLTVWRKVQVERQNLVLGVTMVETQRRDRLTNLRAKSTRRGREHQLRDLLRDGRSAFDDTRAAQVVSGRAYDADRIDSDVMIKAMILGRDGPLRDFVGNHVG